jgi:hypothetical protein
MRTLILILPVAAVTLFLMGCAAGISPLIGSSGAIYTDVSGPVTATSATTPFSKVGMAYTTTYFWLVATGDASIQTAMKNGGITKIHHVDYKATSILGVYTKVTTFVYGD